MKLNFWKKGLVLVTAALLCVSSGTAAFAGEWKYSHIGWYYQEDNGSYVKNGWRWIDGKCYYFDGQGICLLNTTTPDGYKVDNTGAWVLNGVVQIQGQQGNADAKPEVRQLGSLEITIPLGFTHRQTDGNAQMFVTPDDRIGMFIQAQKLDVGQGFVLEEAVIKQVLDQSMQQSFGPAVSSEVKQFPSGTWHCYAYPDASGFGMAGQLRAYVQVADGMIQMVLFCGYLNETNTDTIMAEAIVKAQPGAPASQGAETPGPGQQSAGAPVPSQQSAGAPAADQQNAGTPASDQQSDGTQMPDQEIPR